jgi:hypothetical protein
MIYGWQPRVLGLIALLLSMIFSTLIFPKSRPRIIHGKMKNQNYCRSAYQEENYIYVTLDTKSTIEEY